MADVGSILGGTPYHVGIIVTDLDEGMRRYGALFGLPWGAPMGARNAVEIDGGRRELDFAAVYSRGEGMHVELVQAIPGTIWAAREGLHHLGFWSSDVPGESAALAAAGYPAVVRFTSEPGAPPMITMHADPGGTYVELVDEAQLGPFIRESWA